eukprot:g7730.t1
MLRGESPDGDFDDKGTKWRWVFSLPPEHFQHSKSKGGEASLLVISLDCAQWLWFTPLLDKCDPSVKWEERGDIVSMCGKLANVQPEETRARIVAEWTAAMKKRGKLTPTPTPTPDPEGAADDWGTIFPLAKLALAAAALTVVGAVVAAAVVPPTLAKTLPPLLQEVTKNHQEWQTAKNDETHRYAAREGIHQQMGDRVENILKIHDKRLEMAVSDETYQTSVIDDTADLRDFLENQTKEMNDCLNFQGGGIPGRRVGGYDDTMLREMKMREMATQLREWKDKVDAKYRDEVKMYKICSIHQQLSNRDVCNAGDNS